MALKCAIASVRRVGASPSIISAIALPRSVSTAAGMRRAAATEGGAVTSAEAEETGMLGSVAPDAVAKAAANVNRATLVQREKVKGIHHSAQKLNEMLAPLRGLPINAVRLQLKFSQKRHATEVLKAVERGIANAQRQRGLDPAKLHLAEAIVNQGKPLRRLEIKARSRTGMRHRPRSHVLLALKERPERVDATAARLATLARRAPRERKVYSFAG